MNKTAIVCVDDEDIILNSLGKQLKRNLGQQYDIELASSGEEALQLCEELSKEGINIALVISDQMMPEMSGDEFLVMLHAYYPQTLKILLTGRAEADSVGNIVNSASLYRYIAKPWDETDLILTVKEALRRYGQDKKIVRQNILLNKTNSKLQQINDKLSQSLELLLATFEAADDGILVLDKCGAVVIFNQQFTNLLQIDPLSIDRDSNHILSLICRRLIKPVTCNINNKSSGKNRQYELLQLNNGTILESYFQIQRLNSEIVGTVWGFRDVTARERAKALAKQKSQEDTLTKLPKRRILSLQLADAITKAKEKSHQLAVMFVDLDRFKIISDTLGHQIADSIIKLAVQRLKKCLKNEDLIARWSRDEFTILFPKINSQEDTDAIAKKILDVFKSPFNIASKSIYINSHIGVAIYPQHGHYAATILEKADAALTQARQFGSNNYQYYDRILNSQAQKLLSIENLLHSALEKDEFELYYQPIVNVITGDITKMEALLRWNNPQLGLVSPDTFIPIAEENGQIVEIGEWVLKTACTQNKIWQQMNLRPIKMSVNLSVRQFERSKLVEKIISILQQTALKPSFLELEITESITIDNTELVKTILDRLNDLGISLSMDDFGTGYSSLGYLKKFPFQTLKIDRSLVKDLHSNSQDLAIINAAIALGEGLNLNVVAEGVETHEIKELLINMGCQYVQGYLFSKPLPVDEATKLLQSDRSSSARPIQDDVLPEKTQDK